MSKIWATALKDWVELRESSEKPKVHHSSVTRDSKEKKRTPRYRADGTWDGQYTETEIPKSFVIKITSFTGGKVVSVIKRRSFSERTGITLREGDIREVPHEMAVPILNDDWKTRHNVK